VKGREVCGTGRKACDVVVLKVGPVQVVLEEHWTKGR